MLLNILTANRLRVLKEQVRHPVRLANYVGTKVAYRLELDRTPFMPSVLDVEPNNDCNLKCPHCQVTHWAKERAHLGMDAFNRILDQVPLLSRLKLQGMGEPTLNKSLSSMLKEAENRGISIQFNSNGTIMTDALAKELSGLKQTHLYFSLDGASKETFESVRVGSKFEKIKKNIAKLIEVRQGAQSLRVSAWMVLTRTNLPELNDVIRLVKELGMDTFTVQPNLCSWGQDEMKAYTEAQRVAEDANLDGILRDAKKLAAEIGVTFEVNQADAYTQKKKCPWPWTGAYVASNGDVVPCCILANSDTVKMGNVFEQSFKEIWNGPAYREMRSRIARHDLPEYCTGCYRQDLPAGAEV